MPAVCSRSAPKVRNWNIRLADDRIVEIVASELPANRVCGDISDVFQAGEDSLLIAMGDASGHGVAAGMLIVDIRRLLSMMASSGYAPGEMMGHVNRHVMKRFPTSRFVTMTLLKIDLRTGATTFATGGQPFYRLGPDGATLSYDSDNAPIGIIDDEVFTTMPLPGLEPDESLILISDGFREALTDDGKMYGESRLFEQFANGRSLPPLELVDRLHADVDDYKCGNTDHDDMTVVIVRAKQP